MEMARTCAHVCAYTRVREKCVKKKPKIVLRKTKNAQIWHISAWVRPSYQTGIQALESPVMALKRVKEFNINLC